MKKLKNKITQILYITSTLLLIGTTNLYSVPAVQHLMEITQPDGTQFNAYLKGDEYFNWWESEKGDVLIRNLGSGYFEYAKILIINDKEELISSGIPFVLGEKFPSLLSKILKPDLGRLWKNKIETEREKLQEILNNQK